MARCPDGKCNRSDSQYAFNYSPHGPNKRRLGHLWQCGPCRQRYLENVSRRRFGIGMSHSQTHSLSLSSHVCASPSRSACSVKFCLFCLFEARAMCHATRGLRLATCDYLTPLPHQQHSTACVDGVFPLTHARQQQQQQQEQHKQQQQQQSQSSRRAITRHRKPTRHIHTHTDTHTRIQGKGQPCQAHSTAHTSRNLTEEQ